MEKSEMGEESNINREDSIMSGYSHSSALIFDLTIEQYEFLYTRLPKGYSLRPLSSAHLKKNSSKKEPVKKILLNVQINKLSILIILNIIFFQFLLEWELITKREETCSYSRNLRFLTSSQTKRKILQLQRTHSHKQRFLKR